MPNKKRKKIGLVHFRIGETDGVSLEMEKWKKVLETMGHKVIYIAGSGGTITDYFQLKTLHYKHPENQWLVDVLYKRSIPDIDEVEVKKRLNAYKEAIKQELFQMLIKTELDVLIVNNILSLGWNLAAGLAFREVAEKTGVKLIGHHHDFYWERPLYLKPKYSWVEDMLREGFPPKSKMMKHVVINKIAQEELKKRGFESMVVPNVFDFEHKTDHNQGRVAPQLFRKKLGIKDDEIVFLQATRVVPRKGIELIVQVIASFNQQIATMTGEKLFDGRKINASTKAILVLAGKNEDPVYYNQILAYGKTKNVIIKDLSNVFAYEGKSYRNSEEIYSFWDAYLLADIVSYPSLLEGFGNQFLEAVYEQKPVVMYEYPVYVTDLSSYNFSVISLGHNYEIHDGLAQVGEEIVKESVAYIRQLLLDEKTYKQQVDGNFQIGLNNFSYRSLNRKLGQLVEGVKYD